MKNLAYKLSVLYTVLMLVPVTLFIALLLVNGYNKPIPVGCFAGDALLVGIRCQGFVGADIMSLFINIPLALIQLVIAKGGPFSFVFLLLPILFVVWCAAKKLTSKGSGRIPRRCL